LRAAGHEVSAPTLTGSGERVHLASREIGLDTHFQDILPGADRTTDFLLKAAQQPVTVNNPQAAQLARTYVAFTAKPPDDLHKGIFERIAARARAEGWNYREMAIAHDGILAAPHDVAALLHELAGARA
jgi:hypothetical protein